MSAPYRRLVRQARTQPRDQRLGDGGGGIAWLDSRQQLGITPGLSRVQALLTAAGNPQDAYRSVHIAGTNGKGSVATYLASALQRSGIRTGLFTSPHLTDVTETISVDGQPISTGQLTDLADELRPSTTDLDKTGDPPTYFELLTVLALIWFRDVGVDWAVVEAGMGGRLDSTNTLQPQLTVITNVTEDHTDYLGGDISSIAAEKAGIVKPGVPLVTAARGEALTVIKNTATSLRVPMIVVGEDYQTVPTGDGFRVDTRTGVRQYILAARGEHQVENAAVAVASCDVLTASGVNIPSAAVEETLAEVTLPCRIETFHLDGVRVILDGAHNLAGARSLRRYLDTLGVSFDLIVGFSSNKDWPAMVEQWVPVARRIIAVSIRSPRSLDPSLVGNQVPDGLPFTAASGFQTAWLDVLESGARDILVAGSLFLVGEARSHLINMTATRDRNADGFS